MTPTPPLRDAIARKVRELRTGRGLSQAELAKVLGLSQNRLSELERGQGSFSAEQFLTLLRTFNVTTGAFVPEDPAGTAALQNALARQGASHLVEDPGLLPSERLEATEAVIRETLVAGDSPRHLTALAPVLVAHLEDVNLARLSARFQDLGLLHRLGWLLENTLEALKQFRPESRSEESRVRRAQALLQASAERLRASASLRGPEAPEDVLGTPIRSAKTLHAVRAAASPISRTWGILSLIQPQDFLEALNGARLAH